MFYIQNLYEQAFKLNRVIIEYPTPSNLSYFWNFGSLAGFFLFLQICTGLFLAFWYIPDATEAYNSVNIIMTDVRFGFLARFLHANGASFFFLVVYLHMGRALFFCSYTFPREKIWYSGMIIFLLMILTAFLGYVLPWGQMSYWAATVISTLVSTVPIIGNNLLIFLWGGMSIDKPTLTRIYGLHFLLPFIVLACVILHIVFLHEKGSSNPISVGYSDYIPFNPYFSWKDIQGVNFCIFIFYILIFFLPLLLGHSDNFIPGDALITPTHIVPEWYFLPFYGILRSVPSKVGGVLVLACALLTLFILPLWHDPFIKNIVFRPLFTRVMYLFYLNWFILGWSGGQPVESPFYSVCQFSTLTFFYILIGMPWLEFYEDHICTKLNINPNNLVVLKINRNGYAF